MANWRSESAAMLTKLIAEVGDNYDTVTWQDLNGTNTWTTKCVILPKDSRPTREQASLQGGPSTQYDVFFLQNANIPPANARTYLRGVTYILLKVDSYFDERYEGIAEGSY